MSLFKLNIKYSVYRSVIGALTVGTCYSAQALNLPDSPLLLEASVEPNVMLVLDDSGSMGSIVKPDAYDSSATYGSCASPLAATVTIDDILYWYNFFTWTDANGNAVFWYDGADYAWGDTGGTDATTGFNHGCFDPIENYYVEFSPGYWAFESGNFWNYYYSNTDQTDGDNWGSEDRKPGVGSRMQIVQDAATNLLLNLDGIRIGLGGFNGGSGGRVITGVKSIDDVVDVGTGETQRERLVSGVDAIVASGVTPLGETLYEMGRYFTSGYTSETLTLHPDGTTGTEREATSADVFADAPANETGEAFPSTADPVIQAYCQKNFVVMLTDGQPVSDSEISTELASYDSDGASGPLDDAALALFDIDLRPDLNEFDGTPVKNNVTTYIIGGFGLSSSSVLTNAVNNGIGFGVDPNVDEPGILYEADDGDQLVSTFDTIFEEIFASAGSLTAVSFNSGSLDTGTALYQATFSRAEFKWLGDLEVFEWDVDNEVFSSTASWSAADKLDARVTANDHTDRLILTMSATSDGVAFTEAEWANLPAVAQNDLRGGDTEAHGKEVLNYIRGDDNPLFRDRTEADGSLGLLGDIVNSSPVEVGVPEIGYPDYGAAMPNGTTATFFGTSSNSYSDFETAQSSRASMVYVGANDGMLHAFYGDPTTGGEEAFAYIPSQVFDDSSTEDGLYYLTNIEYEHNFYVDGVLTPSDVFIDPAGGSSDSWRTVLVGGLRAGGRGLFALDITDPTNFTSDAADIATMALWESDGNADSDMGHVYGEARVAMMANGKWAVITGNGYNSDAGEAKIFIIYVEEGADGSWDVGDWVELDTAVTGDNGMNAPVVADLDGDFIADRIYAGDLKGNLWVYDVTDLSDSNWQSAYLDGLGAPEPLFTATDSLGVAQPITSRPLITINPDTATSGNGVNVLAYFGTGKFIEQSDFTDSQNQSFYAVWDRGTDSLTRSNLEVRTITAATATDDDGNTFDTRTVSGNEVSWWNGSSGEYGWYMDFLETGERLTVSPAIFANNIFMLTSVPSSAACSNGGQGWVMSVSTSGLPSNQPPYDINDDGVTDEDDYGFIGNPILTGLPSGSSFIGTSESVTGEESCRSLLQVYSDSQGNLTNEYLQLCSNAVGRMSWQEMLVH